MNINIDILRKSSNYALNVEHMKIREYSNMAAPMENSKLSKADRKRMKKQIRSQKNLWRRDGIETSEVPTKVQLFN